MITALVVPRVIYGSLFFVLSSVLLVLTQPSFAFYSDGVKKERRLKQFGWSEGNDAAAAAAEKTFFALSAVIPTTAIICFFVFAWVDMVFSRRMVIA
jgi:hypothetical protein